MEDEIQAGEDGFYCVGFKNVFALLRDQIHVEFSKYGNVHSVRGAVDGTETNFWAFVRFRNPEEAVRAITGMRASPHLCDVKFVKYMNNSRRDRSRVRDSTAGAAPASAPAAGTGVSPLVRADETVEVVEETQPARPSKRPTRRGGRNSGTPRNFEVFVGNWPMELGEDDIYELFNKFSIKALSVRLYKKEEKR